MKIIRGLFTFDGIGVLCLMLPLMSKWVLPPSIEMKLYYEVGGMFNLFIPNILLLFAPCFFRKNSLYSSGIKHLFWLWVCVELIVIFISDTPNICINIFSNSFLFGALYLGAFHKFSELQVRLLKPICIFIIILISLQIIILSIGLVEYDLGDVGEEFGGVVRVYTTAGESNGSGDLIGILMLIFLLIEKRILINTAIVIIAVIAVFLTVSRAPIAMIILAIVYIWFKYLKKSLKLNTIFIIIVVAFSYIGVFNPIIERTKNKRDDGNITSGRDVLIESVLRNVNNQNAQFLGLGVGNVYQTTEVTYSGVKMPYPGVPHNSYILFYAEQGIVGLILLSLVFAIFLLRSYRKNRDACVILILLLMTIYNTETVISVNSDYVYLTAILMLLISSNVEYRFVTPTPKSLKK